MTYNDIIAALRDIGLGGTDALTHETVISGATLDESINGDGGLTVSWKSTEGGMIRGGTMFMGYVMKENYVPTLGSDGIYMWSPKFSEPAVLLGKNNFGKSLLLHVSSDIYVKKATEEVAATVVAVVDTDRDLPAVTSLSTGTFAIVKNPKTIYASNSRLRKVIVFQGVKQWSDKGQVISENGICRKGATGHYWRYVGGGWIDIGAGDGTVESTVYTSPFCGELRTIVEDLNTLLAQKLPGSPNFSIELRSDNPDSEEAEAEVYALSQTFINVTFDGSTLKELIDKIAEAADAHAYYVGRKIIIGRTRAYADTDFFNRFIVLGGTKNMAKRTFNGQGYAAITQRLHLDENDYPGSVIDLRTKDEHGNYVEAPFETFLVFDEVYPKLNLNIDTAKYCLCYCLDEDGKKIVDHWEKNGETVSEDTDGAEAVYKLYAKWYVTLELDGAGYEIDKSYIIQDKPLSLLFQSGPLTGRQFELTMLTTGTIDRSPDFAYKVVGDNNSLEGSHEVVAGECYIILEADGTLQLPTLPAGFDNGGLCPQAGNWVTLVNVAIEDRLRVVAQRELLEKGLERARLIYESKQPTVTEERTFTDVITGEGSGAVPGLGKPYKGYIVTGISENVITGVKTVTYGTFKPKSLLKSAIDKIEAFTLSGGESTTGKEVSTKTDGQTTYIYIHDGNEGGDNSTPNSGKSSGTSQGSATAIREAGGNTNIKTIYKKMNEGSALGELVRLVWNHLGNGRPSYVSIVFDSDSEASHSSGYWYYSHENTQVLKYNGREVDNAPELVAAFDSVYAIGGDKTYTLYTESKPGTPAENDIYAKVMILTLGEDEGEEETIEGGLLAWLWDGEEWVPILESTSAMINNLGSAIELVVFGGIGNDINDMIEAAGMLTTQNAVNLFATSMLPDGTPLSEAVFSLGIKYRVSTVHGGEHGWYDVWYDYETGKWYFSDDDTEVDQGDIVDIEPYSFDTMRADVQYLLASESFKVAVGNSACSLQMVMSTEGNSESFALQSYWNGTAVDVLSFTRTTESGVVKRKLSLTSDNVIINANVFTANAANMVSAMVGETGVKVYKTNSGSAVRLGVFNNGSETAGISFDYTTSGSGSSARTKLTLNSDNVQISGDSVNFTASNFISLSNGVDDSGTMVGLAISKQNGNQLQLGKWDSSQNFAGLTLTRQNSSSPWKLYLTADNCSMVISDLFTVNAGDINFTGQTVTLTGTTTVNLTGATVNLSTGTLNLNTGTLNLNAGRINWLKEGSGQGQYDGVVIPGEQSGDPDKFSVDEHGNVTMNDLTANNATLSGILTSTGVRTKITIDATDGSDTDTAMKMFALVSDNGSTIAKPVLKVGIDDYLYDENDPQSVYQEGAIEICTTDEVHPYRKATVRPQRITVEGNSYVTEIKPSHYYIYNRSDYYSGNNPTPLLEISDSGVRHGGVFKFWTDILANS